MSHSPSDIAAALAACPVPLTDGGSHVVCAFCRAAARIEPAADGVNYRIALSEHSERCPYRMAKEWRGAESPTGRLAVKVTKDGVFVGGQHMAGMVRWDFRAIPSQGLHEVTLVLATDKVSVDLEAPKGRIL